MKKITESELRKYQKINYDATLVGRYAKAEPYFVGLHNGMELAISFLEGSEPKFESIQRLSILQKIHRWYMQKIWKPTVVSQFNKLQTISEEK